MTASHAILAATMIIAAPCLIALMAWEVYRHYDEICDLGRKTRDSER